MNDMKSQLNLLADALRKRIALIQDREFYKRDPNGHLEALKSISEEITRLQSELPPVSPELSHYLDRCSYDKALLWIEANG